MGGRLPCRDRGAPRPNLTAGSASINFRRLIVVPRVTDSLVCASTLVVARRTLTSFARTPQLVVVATVQGAMFLLSFRYVFGGAIGQSDGASYFDFMVPGFVVASVLFSGMGAAAGVAEDVHRGVVDRLRSLPIPRASLAGGRALGETALLTWASSSRPRSVWRSGSGQPLRSPTRSSRSARNHLEDAPW